MSSNTIRPVVFRAGRFARLEASVRTLPIQTRCFSATAPSQLGNVITFRKTSNETLDSILRELHSKVILPSYLPIPLQNRIFRTRWKAKLEIEPIEIEVEGQQIKLRHIPLAPNAKKELFKALDAMQTKQDWAQLPKLLEGLWYHARRNLVPGVWPRIVRKAGMTGNLGPIFEACQRPERTGMRLSRPEVAQEFMSALVWEATEAGWSVGATRQAVDGAVKVVAFLQEEGHQLTGPAKAAAEKAGWHPLKRDPQMMAHPVLFAAAMVVMHGRRDEYMPVLKKYAQLMLERWPEGKGLLELHPHVAYVDEASACYLMEKGKFLIVASPILKGFELAMEAFGSDPMAEEIKSRRDALAEEVQSALSAKEHKNKRGQQMYDRVFKEHPVYKERPAPQPKAEAATEAKAEA
ncbi:unnamed protein product [Discula destructiva]